MVEDTGAPSTNSGVALWSELVGAENTVLWKQCKATKRNIMGKERLGTSHLETGPFYRFGVLIFNRVDIDKLKLNPAERRIVSEKGSPTTPVLVSTER